jgi:hypothetical protein
VPAALDHPSDAHRLASPRQGVNGDLMKTRYAFLTCHLRCLNRRGRLSQLNMAWRTLRQAH